MRPPTAGRLGRLCMRILALAALLVLPGAAMEQRATRAESRVEADRLAAKIAGIAGYAQTPRHERSRPFRTTLTQREINGYFEHYLSDVAPAGVAEASLQIDDDGRVAGRAVVDLDAVRTQRERGTLDPMNLLTGRLPVTATGIIRARGGTATLELLSASVAGVPVPKLVLQELVSYYTRSPAYPTGVSLDDPFTLPMDIREIQLQRGQAIVIQ